MLCIVNTWVKAFTIERQKSGITIDLFTKIISFINNFWIFCINWMKKIAYRLSVLRIEKKNSYSYDKYFVEVFSVEIRFLKHNV